MTAQIVSLCAARAATEAALNEIDAMCGDIWELVDAGSYELALTTADVLRELKLPALAGKKAERARDFCARWFAVEIGLRMSEPENAGDAA
jgi:hypothetical protein